MLKMMMEARAVWLDMSQGCGGRWRSRSRTLSTPNWGLYIHHQTMAAATVLVTMGEKYTALKNSLRWNFALKRTARIRPRKAEMGTMVTTKVRVLTVALRKISSVSRAVKF